ncbi:MAG: LD-carboxypeptidase [Bacteroidales bacterium]|jgi:muramoyltetrapeptide carboxypeptidase|nr:LD-carboxypeptidase [Bacteroidales bacterium]MBR4327217.1 LD-carboxypeptidase [Bacteroidales bacterium]
MKKLIIVPAIAALILSSCKKEEIVYEQVTVDTTIVNVTEYNPTFVIQDLEPITQTVIPPYLHQGDKVAVYAPSNATSDEDIRDGINTLKSWGLEVIEADNLTLSYSRYAGTLDERVKALQKLLDDDEIRAIFMARGGYGAAQLLPCLDWRKMKQAPKWIVGYSDVTALHIYVNNMGIASIQGPMMRGFNKDATSVNALKAMIFGEKADIEIPYNDDCIQGSATGRIVGGNLSLIYAMSGTAFDLNTSNSILFIEDTGEANYSVDRMLLSLQQSGKLQNVKGIIVGEFSGGSQGSDLPLNEIIRKYVGKLNIPVVYGVLSGHDTVNLPIMFGREATITVDGTTAKIEFDKTVAK